MKIFWDAVTLTNVGYEVAQIIQERTLRGIDKDGKAFIPYSTRPFAIPAAAIQRYAIKSLKQSDSIRFFKKNDITWAVVMGGYKQLKDLQFKKAGGAGVVNLTATGEMWGAFGVLGTTPHGVKLGFNTPRSAMIMKYNQERGRDPLGFQLSELSHKALEYLSDIRIEW